MRLVLTVELDIVKSSERILAQHTRHLRVLRLLYRLALTTTRAARLAPAIFTWLKMACVRLGLRLRMKHGIEVS